MFCFHLLHKKAKAEDHARGSGMENQYKAAYATTGRAKCKLSSCKQKIEKGALRV